MNPTVAPNVSPLSVMLTSVLPFAIVFVVMYLLVIRPQKMKQKDREAVLEALKKGDKVLTQGGLVGTVFAFKDSDIVVLKMGESAKVEILRSHIVSPFS